MENKRNYYRILHVQFDAPASVINASYRAMMQKLRMHPDLGGEEWSASLINEARNVLLNPELRAEYDKQLKVAAKSSDRNPARKKNSSSVGGRPNDDFQYATDERDKGSFHAEPTAAQQYDSLCFDTPQRCQFCLNPVSVEQPGLPEYSTTRRCTQCDGPLGRVESYRSLKSDDLRQVHRSVFEQTATVWDKWPLVTAYEARVRDWSTAGCSIEMATKVDDKSTILLLAPAFDATARVRYQSRRATNRIGLGLEFINLDIKMNPGSIFVSAA